MKSTEIESKRPLTKDEYEALRAYMLPRGHEEMQINYYYDTEDRALRSHGINLRARRRGEVLTLEVKRHRSFEGNLRVCEEFSARIDSLPATVKVEKDGRLLIARLLGELITIRLDVSGEGYIASLDKSLYLGQVDYELEVEYNGISALPADTAEIFGAFPERTPGKYARFLAALDKASYSEHTVTISDDNVKMI